MRSRKDTSDTIHYESPTRVMWLRTSIILAAVAPLLTPVILLFTVPLSRTQLLAMILVSVCLFSCVLSVSTRLKPIEILIGVAA